MQGIDHVIGKAANFFDLTCDIFGSAGGLGGEVFDFARDNSESLTGVTGACCLDRGVQGKQVGLVGDVFDQADDITDPLGGVGQLFKQGA